jgi:multisubunit Na+/H+ antiporter MnhB subunit
MAGWLVYGVANSAVTAALVATVAAAAMLWAFQSWMKAEATAGGEAPGLGGMATVVVVAMTVVDVVVVAMVGGTAALLL